MEMSIIIHHIHVTSPWQINNLKRPTLVLRRDKNKGLESLSIKNA